MSTRSQLGRSVGTFGHSRPMWPGLPRSTGMGFQGQVSQEDKGEVPDVVFMTRLRINTGLFPACSRQTQNFTPVQREGTQAVTLWEKSQRLCKKDVRDGTGYGRDLRKNPSDAQSDKNFSTSVLASSFCIVSFDARKF